jgi:hypothetical protein
VTINKVTISRVPCVRWRARRIVGATISVPVINLKTGDHETATVVFDDKRRS